jgi:two-component system, LuxR family, response regulator FixJ
MSEQHVFIVDDDPGVRKAVSFVIASAGFSVKSFASADAFLDAYDDSLRGCIVLDVKMPGLTGPELQKILIDRRITLPIVFLTGHGDIPTSVKAMRAGAVDFVEKPFDKDQLLDSIRCAMKKEVRDRHKSTRRAAIMERRDLLTNRELQVMELLVLGKQTKNIARELGISPKTVDNHRTNVLEKMQADSVVELVSMIHAARISPCPAGGGAELRNHQ